jgi:aminoglycoside phosphotransferase (APT) family kinase protein
VLSAADADLASRDHGLPALATLLDADAFLEALRKALPETPFDRATPTYVRYKPGTNCLVAYRLDGPETLEVYAKAHGVDAESKLHKASEQTHVEGALGAGRIALPGAGIVVSVFPNDAKLRSIRRLGDPAARRHLFSRILPERPELWEGSIETLRYKPERRYVARLSAGPAAPVALKFTLEEDFAAVNANAKRYRSREVLRLPERVGVLKAQGVLALEWIEGVSLAEALAGEESVAVALGQVAAALGELHERRGKKLPTRTTETDAALLRSNAAGLARLWPPLASRVRDLAGRIFSRLREPSSDACMVHGDFYDRQVILCGERVAVLDLDRAARASPLVDLGTFVAHLERAAAMDRLPDSRARESAANLVEAYRAVRGALPHGLEAHCAMALLQLAAEPFREHAPDWPERIEALLERAERLLGTRDALG